ncbi:copper homeostasis protein CutC [Aliifodinibius salicampi]|uniref:PF03932 family protein CutC n=1 Tax=Fodinibius salicampi TaxID=1920655 RepID=A0ABT3Q0U7_9BACT|nr:copper homeostasis protein CutC [Fodinibius salicampi]MCW9713730.1 copper homeostasis protein CutC [Fodinibius salicampi]
MNGEPALTTEVVVYNIESALNAQKGGADRIELCDNPGGGGTTPSLGTIEVLREALDISLFVMIRPREGDFCYSALEFKAMKRDIAHCKELGVDGVVFGILSPDGTLDRKRCGELVELARPLQVTCHRAFDMTKDPFAALGDCVESGFDRILTSGQKARALEGATLIGELVEKSRGRISIMAGCGVNEESVKEIVGSTGINEIHLSAETTRESLMEYKNPKIKGMGSTTGKEYVVSTVSAQRVREICKNGLDAQKSSLPGIEENSQL